MDRIEVCVPLGAAGRRPGGFYFGMGDGGIDFGWNDHGAAETDNDDLRAAVRDMCPLEAMAE